MKKLIIVSLLLLPLTNAVAISNNDSMAFSKKDRKNAREAGEMSISSTSFTRFTSDTSDATNGNDRRSRKLVELVAGNMDNLARDMSLGNGEVLSTLVAVWEMSAEDSIIFNGLVQEKFPEIFTSVNITSQELLINLNALVSNNESLAKYSLS